MEDKNRAVRSGKGGHGRAHRFQLIALFENGIKRDPSLGDLGNPTILIVRVVVFQGHATKDAVMAEAIANVVEDDRIKPGREAGTVLKIGKVPVGVDEGVLKNVFGFRLASE